MNLLRFYRRLSKCVATVVLVVLVVEVISGVLQNGLSITARALAAAVVIEGAPSTDSPSHTTAGSQTVFVDDQEGYKFFRATAGSCAYRKSTNGGTSWGAAITVDNQTDCVGVVVWYDQWTPGDLTGSYIHIATMDTSASDLFYNRLDTETDSLLLVTSTSTTLDSTSTYVSATNRPTITKASDGRIYLSADDATGTGSEIKSCLLNCNIGSNWVDVGVFPQGNTDTWSLLMPSTNDDVVLINRSTTNLLRYSLWNGTSWSAMVNIDASAIRNGTYDVGMAATVDTDSGAIYLVYVADNDNFVTADHDIRTAVYSGGSWTNTTSILTNATTTPGILQVAIGRDQNNGDIYVAYTARTTIATAATANTYWIKSSNNMSSWGARSAAINTAPGDFYGIDLTLMSYERIYASWFDGVAAVRDIFGETLADVSPEVVVRGFGAQRTPVRAETVNYYVGGGFSVKSLSSRSVSSVILAESGTVDGQTELDNIRMYYDIDSSAPYDCASESYAGSETQFGATSTNSFSGSNGTTTFTHSPVSIGPTQTLCLYTVADILSAADDTDTIELQILNAATDVAVTGVTAHPPSPVSVASTTSIVDPKLTQTHYHWRNDNGNEAGATSATDGVADTALTSLSKGSPRRLRMQVSNEGSTTSLPVSLQIEYGVAAPSCQTITSWTTVTATTSWAVSNTANLTHGANTTNIAVGTGGVIDENTVFLTPNTGVMDTSASTSNITLGITNFVELEISLVAATTTVEGETYCFRATRNGTELGAYSVYPQATIASDVVVQATGTQATTSDVGATNTYYGGVFRLIENSSARNVTSVTFTEEGTVNAQTGISSVKLRTEFDTTEPYNCESVAYGGAETQFGSTQTSFSGPNGTVTFTGSLPISTTSAACLYLEYSLTTEAINGESVNIFIESPSANVIVSGGGSVGPSMRIDVNGTTTVRGGVLTQTHYHWRNNNGTEVTASSASSGTEDTAVTDFARSTPLRLRVGVHNAGATTSSPSALQLEYGVKVTTCANVSGWTNVEAASDAFDMYDSANLTEGSNTTNIATSTGGITDVGSLFVTPNGAVRDTTSRLATTSYLTNNLVEMEFSITSSVSTSFLTTYCFRVTAGGTALPVYDRYAELTTAPKRDFKVQRGFVQVTGTSSVITAGIDYVAPRSTSTAFIRITNTQNTGAGLNSGGLTQNADDVTAYIENPSNLLTSVRFARPSTAINSTRVYWEILEFIGESGTDNQMIVRQASTVSMGATALTATGTLVTGVGSSSDVVVFVTGAQTRNITTAFHSAQVTASWGSTTNQAILQRGNAGAAIGDFSFAVVEFQGQNWTVQRVEHAYTASGTVETESITPVNSLSRTFIHTQKRMGADVNVVHLGHEVWLSSIGSVSFQLEPTSATTSQASVAWVIENSQSGGIPMVVQRSNGSTTGGTAPLTLAVTLSPTISATNNASIFATTRAATAGINHPRAHAGITIASTTAYTIWRSNTGASMSYRTEVVEWPVSDIGLRQNNYRLYVHNNAVTPTDAWPPGLVDLGENTGIGTSTQPLGQGDTIRVRTSMQVSNATMPAGYRALKLQYGVRNTGSCSAITVWNDVGSATSSEIWRGFIATGTTDGVALGSDPSGVGEVLLSQSDVAGVLVHQNPSAVNPYGVLTGQDVEYDWQIEQNGAVSSTVYCFRMIQSDSTTLDGYLQYPQIRTAGFTPVTQNWRWYSDYFNETPLIASSTINSAPIDIALASGIALRVTVKETKAIPQNNSRFKLQYSSNSNFDTAIDVVATSTCAGNSAWCYIDGGGADNALISTRLLDDSGPCVAGVGSGCGRHVSSPTNLSGHTHTASTAQEYSFQLKNMAARPSTVYYFRLYDSANSDIVPLGSGEAYPSLVTQSPTLQFTVAGLPSGTSTAGIVTNTAASSTGINFGTLAFNTDYIGGHRITVDTNAPEGYQVLKYVRQQLLNSYGESIPPLSSSNAVPTGWGSVCTASTTGCAGYHTTDSTLRGGSTRFSAVDSYAGLSTSPSEIMYSSLPATDTSDIVYRVRASTLQPAGNYQTEVVYLAIPTQ